MPLISVIVPCYNQAQYLDECLQSVLDQTYQDWECIIVNDGSPDNTEEVAKKWLAKDSRFKYLYKDNGGLSSARNAGIKESKGEYVLLLNPDTLVQKDTFEKCVEYMDSNPQAGSLGVKMINGKGEFLPESKRSLPVPGK